MSRNNIPGRVLSVLAVAGLMASSMASTAGAGTGGSDAAGITYGEGSQYCEVSNQAIRKVDSASGDVLNDAVFHVTAAAGVGIKAGVYDQADKSEGHVDRDLWQRTFNASVDKAFTATTFGTSYAAARVQLAGTQGTGVEGGGAAGDGGTGVGSAVRVPGSVTETNAGGTKVVQYTVNGMRYTATETFLYPLDYTAITDANSRKAAMTNWVKAPDTAESWAVSRLSVHMKTRLDQIGKVAFVTYNPASPPAAGTALTGPITGALATTRTHIQDEYSRALGMYQSIQQAVTASGYPAAVFTTAGAITPGAVSAPAQNWVSFVAAYNLLVDPDSHSFGLRAPDYPLVSAVAGVAAVAAANQAANAAVGATQAGDGGANGVITLTTDADGRVEYTVFGRLGARTTQAPTNGDCSALVSTAVETEAPNGYGMPAEPAHTIVPRNVVVADAGVQTLTVANDLTKLFVPAPKPVPPVFESGF